MPRRQSAVRATFVAAVAVVLSLSTLEAAEESTGPTELGDSSTIGEGGPVTTVPLEVVRGFAKRLEEENQHLKTVNSALRTTAEVNSAQKRVMVAGGLLKSESKEQKEEDKNAAEGEPVKPPPSKAELSPEMKKGDQVIGAYNKKQQELEDKLSKAQLKLAAVQTNDAEKELESNEALAEAKLASQVEPSEYHHIPFFKFTSGSKPLEDIKDKQACQAVCDRQAKCKSFSWSIQQESCIWSVDSVHYDQQYVFNVKAQIATAGDPEAEWREFPGVKFITAHSQQKENMLFDTCKNQCATDVSCKSFSYRADTKFCAWSSNGLSYDDQWSYYEKDEYSSSTSANLKRKRAQFQKAQDAIKAKMLMQQGKEQKEKEAEQRENELKKKTKQAWLSNAPTNGQEEHLKMTVKMEMRQMDAKIANQAVAKKDAAMQKAQDEFQKAQVAAIARISKLEAEEKKLAADKKESAAALGPAEEKVSLLKVDVAKVDAKLKILDTDYKIKKKVVDQTSQSLEQARASQNQGAIATANGQYKDAKRAVTDLEDERAKLEEELNKHSMALTEAKNDLVAKQTKEKSNKSAMKSKENQTKDAVKKEKADMTKQKQAIASDREKAFTAQLVALKAKEKFAKGNRAQSKVDIQNLEAAMKDIQSEDERQSNEQKMAKARGVLFKSDKTNDETTLAMIDLVKKLAEAKEGVHKNKAKAKQAEETKQRQDVTNKLDKLENAALEAPGDPAGR